MTAQTEQSSGWLQKNSRFLLLLCAVLLGGGGVGWYMPRAAEQSRRASWDLYFQFETALQEADSSSAMLTALLPLKGNSNSYPWALTRAATWAADRKDSESLQAIEAKIAEIDPAASGVKVLENGEPVNLLTSLASRISGLDELSQLEPVLAEPTGSTVVFTLTDAQEKVYTLSYKLYSEQAPKATGRLLENIKADAFSAAAAVPAAQSGIQMEGIGDEGQELLQLERAWGCFHANGTLSSVLENGGEPGQQSSSKLQFLGGDLYGQDGVTTVLGKLVAGEEALVELAALERSAEEPNKFGAEFKISVSIQE